MCVKNYREDLENEALLITSSPLPFQKAVVGISMQPNKSDDQVVFTDKTTHEGNEPPRRIYVREEFTHENSGKVQPDAVKR